MTDANFWKGKRVLVTGGRGFFGSHVVDHLEAAGAHVSAPHSSRRAPFSDAQPRYDLRDRYTVRRILEANEPAVVFHLAARVGGIGANQAMPADMIFDNAIMGLNVIEECMRFGIPRLVLAGSICAYPKHASIPMTEDDLWNGYPEETNAPYGIAKRLMLATAQAYRQQHGLHAIMLFPTNLYGPRDNFDLESSHVIPAMIRKIVSAKVSHDEGNHGDQVKLWGDGTPTREFLYVDDAARAFLLAAELYDDPRPLNIGTGYEISMKALALTIAELVGYEGEIVWDASRPNGQPRRAIDPCPASRLIGFRADTELREGLKKTIGYWRGLSRL